MASHNKPLLQTNNQDNESNPNTYGMNCQIKGCNNPATLYCNWRYYNYSGCSKAFCSGHKAYGCWTQPSSFWQGSNLNKICADCTSTAKKASCLNLIIFLLLCFIGAILYLALAVSNSNWWFGLLLLSNTYYNQL